MSPDLKDVLAATIPSVLPTVMVLYGIMSNKADINHVRTELSSIRGEMGSMRTQVHDEIGALRTEVHSELGALRTELRSEIGGLRNMVHADINGLRSDIATLVNIGNEIDKRVSRLEAKG